jgi:hypothetical protein
LHVIRRRRAEPAPLAPAPAEPPTAVLPTDPPAAPAAAIAAEAIGEAIAPAGADPAGRGRPGFAGRGRLRRRLRYLRRVRELGLRDLGGLVFDQHRFERPDPELVRGKVAALGAVDAELRALERVLDRGTAVTELREPGISACPRCGALHGSDARFCPSCGVPLRGPRAVAGIGEGVSEGVGEIGPLSPSRPAPDPQPTVAMPPVGPAEPTQP